MSWTVLARQDGRLTIGAKSVKYLLALLVAVVLLGAYVYPLFGTDPITTARFGGFVVGWLATLIPLIGVLIGYNAVVSERESGSLLLSLSLPHSRGDVIVGKFLGRAGVLAATIVVAMVGAGALVVYPFGELEVPRSLAFVFLTVVFGMIWTGIGVASSLVVATKRRALVVGFGVFFLFVFAWETAADALRTGLNGAGIIDGELPGAVRFLVAMEPGAVYSRLVTSVDPGGTLEGTWYLGWEVALVAFVCWATVPMGLASLRFAGSDLR